MLEESEQEQLRFNLSAFPTVRDLQKCADEKKDGMKNFANVLTELHAQTILTSPLGEELETRLEHSRTSRANEVKIGLF